MEFYIRRIEQKIAGQEVRIAPEAPSTNVIDLMAALQASLEATKPAVGGATDKAAGGGDAAAPKTRKRRTSAAKDTGS